MTTPDEARAALDRLKAAIEEMDAAKEALREISPADASRGIWLDRVVRASLAAAKAKLG